MDENNEIGLVIDACFDAKDTERETNYANLLLCLNNKDSNYWEFIKHLSKDAVRHYLVALSQDK